MRGSLDSIARVATGQSPMCEAWIRSASNCVERGVEDKGEFWDQVEEAILAMQEVLDE